MHALPIAKWRRTKPHWTPWGSVNCECQSEEYYLKQGYEYDVILLSCRNISLWFAAILLDASARNSLWELKCPAADASQKFIIFASIWRRFCFAVSWLQFIWPWRFILLLICFVWSSVEIWFAVTFSFLPLHLWATVLTTVCAAASAVCHHEGTVLFAFSFLGPVDTMRIFIDTTFCKRNFVRTDRSNNEFRAGC